jgi:predicted MFS family arabinose efflux permease
MLYTASFGALVSFSIMLGITPLFVLDSGYSAFSAAMSTAIFMGATVAAELVTGRIMHRIGPKHTLAIGLVGLGVPVFALLASTELWVILLVSAVRGAGFALIMIAAATILAALVDESKHGRGIGVYGIVVGIPSIVALPFGVWFVGQVGFAPLFILSGAVAALGLLVALARMPLPVPEEIHGLLRTLRQPGVLRLALVFGAVTFATGVLITYLPIAAETSLGAGVAALALLAQALTSTIARLFAGAFGDRRDAGVLVIPALVVGVIGMLVIALAPGLVVLGAAIFGCAFGVLQNGSLQLMFRSSGPSGYGSVSAIWNLAYDIGLGLGAVGFGLLAATYELPLLVSAAVILMAMTFMAISIRRGSVESIQVTPG